MKHSIFGTPITNKFDIGVGWESLTLDDMWIEESWQIWKRLKLGKTIWLKLGRLMNIW
jgi:hypothetical protein